jgi:hypothetical protein
MERWGHMIAPFCGKNVLEKNHVVFLGSDGVAQPFPMQTQRLPKERCTHDGVQCND